MTTIIRNYNNIETIYNRSAIMKLAHQIKKAIGCTLGDALRKAWKAAKSAQKQAVKNATCFWDTVTIDVSFWAKYGKIRGYMNGTKSNPNVKNDKCFDCHLYIDFAE